jgi:sec-independent protein translocase protein TatA
MINQMAIGYQELLIVLFILLLLFGSTRLPQLASGIGKSIRSFKRGLSEGEEEGELEEGRRRESLNAPSQTKDKLHTNKLTEHH